MSEAEPLDAFFARFADLGFGFRRSKTVHSNFERLRKKAGWDEQSDDFHYARKRFDIALTEQFHFVFGRGTDLQSWQKFCTFLEISPVPGTIQECRKVVSETHVNIVDILDCARTGKKVRKYATVEKLRRYTLREKKIFPKEHAKGLLRELLREILSGGSGRGRRRSEKRKKKKEEQQAAAAAAQDRSPESQ